jgi:hypothetical protein
MGKIEEVSMADWKAKAEEACARLGITDEKQRAFVFEHQRRHAIWSAGMARKKKKRGE